MKKAWDTYFLDIAEVVATRSPDPSTQVGCVIINHKKRIVSTGYNGFPQGCDESFMSTERPLKYFLFIHAEDNAISHAEGSLEGCVVYTTQAPCENCLKKILNVGIKRIVFRHWNVLERFSEDQKEALRRLLGSMPDCLVVTESGGMYQNLLK